MTQVSQKWKLYFLITIKKKKMEKESKKRLNKTKIIKNGEAKNIGS